MTTPKLFQPGPAKLRDGREAYIFEVSDKIYMKQKDKEGEWYSSNHDLNGFLHRYESPYDLMPNAPEPETIVIEGVEFLVNEDGCMLSYCYDGYTKLHGKRWTMTLVEEVK